MKGITFTLEAGIAILMVLLMLIFLFRNPPVSLDSRINFRMKAYDGLKVLERTGELRKYAVVDNVTAITDSLRHYIPNFLSYAVVLFNDSTNTTPKPSFSGVNESLSVSYFLAGDFNEYTPREVRVYVWGYE